MTDDWPVRPNLLRLMQDALAKLPKEERRSFKLAPWCRPFAEAIRARGEEVTVESLAQEIGWPISPSDRTESKPFSGQPAAPPPTA